MLRNGASEALRGLVRVPQPSACFCIVQASERQTPLALITFGRRVTDFPRCRKALASALHVSHEVA